MEAGSRQYTGILLREQTLEDYVITKVRKVRKNQEGNNPGRQERGESQTDSCGQDSKCLNSK